MSKITPQQAFEAARVLWPDTTQLELVHGLWSANGTQGTNRINADGKRKCTEFIEIDWPFGVDRWPMPEPKWRDATIEDFIAEREARFSDDGMDWRNSPISGFSRGYDDYQWQTSDGMWWRHCQVCEESVQ